MIYSSEESHVVTQALIGTTVKAFNILHTHEDKKSSGVLSAIFTTQDWNYAVITQMSSERSVPVVTKRFRFIEI